MGLRGDRTGDDETDRADEPLADRVVVSHPADLSEWGRHQLSTRYFRSYLRKTLGRPDPGDVTEEFVGVGCCGSTLDVPLRIERLDCGSQVGPETEIVYEVREACDLAGGWAVQSAEEPG